MRIVLIAGFILCSYFASAQLTAIKCGKLIDGKNDQSLLNKAILVEGKHKRNSIIRTYEYQYLTRYPYRSIFFESVYSIL